MPIEFPYADMQAPRKAFKKDKNTGEVRTVTRISFDAVGIDDETLMAITAAVGSRVKVMITLD